MMGYCCRSSSLSHSGVRGKTEGRRDEERERQTDREGREREKLQLHRREGEHSSQLALRI